jgi:hypothetical protein
MNNSKKERKIDREGEKCSQKDTQNTGSPSLLRLPRLCGKKFFFLFFSISCDLISPLVLFNIHYDKARPLYGRASAFTLNLRKVSGF